MELSIFQYGFEYFKLFFCVIGLYMSCGPMMSPTAVYMRNYVPYLRLSPYVLLLYLFMVYNTNNCCIKVVVKTMTQSALTMLAITRWGGTRYFNMLC